MTFAERLRELRAESGMSYEDVAKQIGCGRANIYKYEHGIVTNIPPERVHQLANLFGVTRPYLMGWTDERNLDPAKNLDTVADKLSIPVTNQLLSKNGKVYWKNIPAKNADCTTAATQAARALIKYKVSRTPIYPQQIIQSADRTTMVSFGNPDEMDDLLWTNSVVTLEAGTLVWISVVAEEDGRDSYLFTFNRNAPMGDLKLELAVALSHVYLGHALNNIGSRKCMRESECFALHLLFPRPMIKLLQERGVVLTKRMFSRIFGHCDECLDFLLDAEPVTISPDLNRILKDQFTPYVDKLEDIGIFLAEPHGEELDLSKYMEGYED